MQRGKNTQKSALHVKPNGHPKTMNFCLQRPLWRAHEVFFDFHVGLSFYIAEFGNYGKIVTFAGRNFSFSLKITDNAGVVLTCLCHYNPSPVVKISPSPAYEI